MLITKKLWENNSDLASLSLKTKFVQGISNGNLPRDIFKDYLAQDYFFLESFAKAYGFAVSKSKDKSEIKSLSQLLSLIHISEPTRLGMISYAVFCLKKKKK